MIKSTRFVLTVSLSSSFISNWSYHHLTYFTHFNFLIFQITWPRQHCQTNPKNLFIVLLHMNSYASMLSLLRLHLVFRLSHLYSTHTAFSSWNSHSIRSLSELNPFDLDHFTSILCLTLIHVSAYYSHLWPFARNLLISAHHAHTYEISD